jgi:phosphatidylglycerophosphatase A
LLQDSKPGRLDKAAEWVWSVAGLGFIPLAPSFWGTLGGLPLYALLFLLGWKAYLAGYAAIFLLGWLVSARSLAFYQKPSQKAVQNQRVVIDRTFGFLTAMFLAPQYDFLVFPFLWGFFLFLLVDYLKPWLVGQANRREGALFIMLDDFLAGLASCFIMWLVAIAHYLFVQPHILPAIFAR